MEILHTWDQLRNVDPFCTGLCSFCSWDFMTVRRQCLSGMILCQKLDPSGADKAVASGVVSGTVLRSPFRFIFFWNLRSIQCVACLKPNFRSLEVLFNTFQHPNEKASQKMTNNWIPSNALQSALRLNQVIKSNDKMKHVARMITVFTAVRTFGRWTASRYWTSVHDTSCILFWKQSSHLKNSDSARYVTGCITLLRRVFIVRIIEVRPKVVVYYRHCYAVYTSDFKRSKMSLSVFRFFHIEEVSKQCWRRQVWIGLRGCKYTCPPSPPSPPSGPIKGMFLKPVDKRPTPPFCLWQVKTCETSSLVWFPTLWLYVWSLSGWCKAKPTSYFAHLIAEYHEACTHPRNEPPTISVVAIEESQVERENHPQQKKYEEPWPLPNVFQSSKSWKSWTIGPWDPHISRWKDLHPLPGHGH